MTGAERMESSQGLSKGAWPLSTSMRMGWEDIIIGRIDEGDDQSFMIFANLMFRLVLVMRQ